MVLPIRRRLHIGSNIDNQHDQLDSVKFILIDIKIDRQGAAGSIATIYRAGANSPSIARRGTVIFDPKPLPPASAYASISAIRRVSHFAATPQHLDIASPPRGTFGDLDEVA